MLPPSLCVQSDLGTGRSVLHVSEYKCGQNTTWNIEEVPLVTVNTFISFPVVFSVMY